MGCYVKAKLSARWLHLACMAMAESCSATRLRVELAKLSWSCKDQPKGSHSELFNHLQYPNHVSQGEGKPGEPCCGALHSAR